MFASPPTTTFCTPVVPASSGRWGFGLVPEIQEKRPQGRIPWMTPSKRTQGNKRGWMWPPPQTWTDEAKANSTGTWAMDRVGGMGNRDPSYCFPPYQVAYLSAPCPSHKTSCFWYSPHTQLQKPSQIIRQVKGWLSHWILQNSCVTPHTRASGHRSGYVGTIGQRKVKLTLG